MSDNSEIAAIIGGSIGGLIVFVIIVTVIIYMLCGSRSKRRHQGEKFRHIARHHEPGHSQNSTMSHMSAERLPKVGSNGLWVGTPGVYANAPSSAYIYGRPYPPGFHRASSDNRPPNFPGHAVYQSNNNMSNLRIYHSQQLSPVYEYIDPTQGPKVVDIYQYGDTHHSRSRLIEQPSSSWKKQKDNKNNHKKILRSKSDATQEQKRQGNRKKTDTNKSSDTKSSANSKLGKSCEAKADVHSYQKGKKSKSTDAIHLGYDNKAFERDSGLATDSMKLQVGKVNPIHNITDDEKKQVIVPSEPEKIEETQPTNHYIYHGDVYAVPEKNLEDCDNPILAKMDNMIRQASNSGSTRYLVEDDINGPGEQESCVYKSAIHEVESTDNPLYSEPHENVNNANIIVTEVVQTTNHVSESETLHNSTTLLHPQPSTSHNILAGSPSLLSERSEVSEDLDVKGKNVTAAAFEFLESYLSDEDDLHMDSRPTSPGTLHTDQGMY